MVDHEKKKNSAGPILAAAILTAAIAGAMIPAGTTGGAPSAAENTELSAGAQTAEAASSETTAEAASSEETAVAAETAASEAAAETAASGNASDEEGSDSTLGNRIKDDGKYVSELVEPAGREEYKSKELLLINPWHLLPEDYEADLEVVEYGHKVDACAAEHLKDMLSDCRDAGYSPLICSSYRDRSKQEILFDNDVRKFMYRGYSEEEAIKETAKSVAVPGSSEHEAGLAVDIVYLRYQVLDESQELNDTQQWLMEHCMEYGFILRYPRDKQDITGITYEPWHYRYVGEKAAGEIMSRGICLEEYLGVIDTVPSGTPGQFGEE